MQRNHSYQPSIDGLRALAALGVFGVHLGQNAETQVRVGPCRLDQFLENGRLGVALFLILSGIVLRHRFGIAAPGPGLPTWQGSFRFDVARRSFRSTG